MTPRSRFDEVQTNQVLYNLTRRGIEWDLLPWCDQRRISVMAYSPIEQGRLLSQRALADVAKRHQATPSQIALAWVLRAGVIAIPRARSLIHVRENRAALDDFFRDEPYCTNGIYERIDIYDWQRGVMA